MKSEPQKEHEWLQQLVGEWLYESECEMEPGKPPQKFKGSETVRSLGRLWVLSEIHGEMPGGEMANMVMTLGYDSLQQRYVGTWVGSMMSHLWVYVGTLDTTDNVLSLYTEGPSCSADGKLVRYMDTIQIKNGDQQIRTSHLLGEDGEWHAFLTADYRRVT
ncbi:MAG: DUF1579 domain-containing protein [Methylomonas sp.]